MKPFLFVTDLDNTLVGDKQALATLNQKLQAHRQAYGTKIVYATGRSLFRYHQLLQEQTLIAPDALVTSVGTEIYFDLNQAKTDSQWALQLKPGWNREQIVAIAAHFADLTPQPDSEQNPFKISYFLTQQAAEEVIPRLKSALSEKGLDVKLIYSAGEDLDLLPQNGDKGLAVQYLRQRWEITSESTVVCGDSGNDIALFERQERGIIVGNAKSELRQWYQANPADYRYFAQAHYSGGILEGLKHFNFI